jgi:L-lactate dehydrogenase complex protein LldF
VASANWARRRDAVRRRPEWEAWRERAQAIRADAVRNLPELLDRLEARMRAAGAHVHRAATAEDANRIVVGLCAGRGTRLAVKGKSMTSEETGLNEALDAAGILAVETDLGEHIVQELGQRPSHLLAPAVHLNAVQVAELFSRLAGRRFDPGDPERLVDYARGALRERFLQADAGITGVNLAVAETGTLVLVESEGNIRLASSLPRLHIALMGIEKVVRDWDGAAHLVQMLPLASHGTPAAASTSFITGPAGPGDDGPEELHLVLLDAGRSALRGTAYEDVLHCIRCGACLYACPVYGQMGGHAYGSTYSGPIGAVLTPLLAPHAEGADELPWLSSLCGACQEACPVRIPLDDRLAMLRAEPLGAPSGPAAAGARAAERALFSAWGRLWGRPASYRATAATGGRALAPLWRRLRALAGGGAVEGWEARAPFPFSGWTETREIRAPAAEPFHARWQRRRGREGAGA